MFTQPMKLFKPFLLFLGIISPALSPILLGLALIAYYIILRVFFGRPTQIAQRLETNRVLPIALFALPLLAGIGLTFYGGISMYRIRPGEERMTFQGRLNVIGGQAFLDPAPNQGLSGRTLMMMRNIPPGGTPAEQINAAPSYFLTTRQKANGDPLSVVGSVFPFGSGQILVVDQ